MSASLQAFLEDPLPGLAAVALAFLSGYLSGRVGKSARRAAACEAFRAAVLTELSGLYPLASSWPENIDGHLRAKFPSLQVAVAKFRPYVPWYKRWLFDRAWSKYRNAHGREVDIQIYHHYMSFNDQPDPKGTLRRNVHKILTFAGDT